MACGELSNSFIPTTSATGFTSAYASDEFMFFRTPSVVFIIHGPLFGRLRRVPVSTRATAPPTMRRAGGEDAWRHEGTSGSGGPQIAVALEHGC